MRYFDALNIRLYIEVAVKDQLPMNNTNILTTDLIEGKEIVKAMELRPDNLIRIYWALNRPNRVGSSCLLLRMEMQ